MTPSVVHPSSTVPELEQRLAGLKRSLAGLTGRDVLSADERNERAQLQREHDDVDGVLRDKRRRLRLLAEAARDGNQSMFEGLPSRRPDEGSVYDAPGLREKRSGALRSIDRVHSEGGLTERAALRLDGHVRSDKQGFESAFLEATASPTYLRAWTRMVVDPHAQLTMPEAERNALAKVSDVAHSRALSVGSPSDGGYAVPFQLDPTVIDTSNGVVNPLRSIARVVTTTTQQWKGVLSDGVLAGYSAEGSEIAEDSPDLVQPVVEVERAGAFVKFSFEIGGDWQGLQAELARMFAAARDEVEALKFLTGLGHVANEPQGLLALDAGSRFPTASVGTLAGDDIYALKNELTSRFQPNASWLASSTVLDYVARFTGPGSDEPPIFVDGTPPKILRKPAYELSTMSTDIDGGEEIAFYGDFKRGFVICDRLSMTIELVPHLFGANRLPLGQRGLVCWWRNSSAILAPEALRLLVVAAS
jgi:HK97 family phage major capsid protein